MQTVSVEIPVEWLKPLELRRDTLREVILLGLSQLRIREALEFYERGLISLARAAEIGGLAREEMMRYARAYGMEPKWNQEMMAEELA